MARACTICNHSQSKQINKMYLQGATYREMSRLYGMSISAFSRHKAHLGSMMSKAEQKMVVEADDLVAEAKQLMVETQAILRECREKGDHNHALKALHRLERQIDLKGRLLGQLREGPTINVWAEFNQSAGQIAEALQGQLQGLAVEAAAVEVHAVEAGEGVGGGGEEGKGTKAVPCLVSPQKSTAPRKQVPRSLPEA